MSNTYDHNPGLALCQIITINTSSYLKNKEKLGLPGMGCSQSKISSSGRVHSLKKWNDMKKELSDFTASLEYRIYLAGITCE